MKRILFLSLSFIMLSEMCFSNNTLQAKIDERVELASIFCHLIGFNYDTNLRECGTYSNAVTDYFSPYERDIHILANPRIPFFKFTPQNHQAILGAALTLKIENGTVTFDSSNTETTLLEKIYSKEDCQLIRNMLANFYTLTSFHTFYESQHDLYLSAENLYNTKVIAKYNPTILENKFGLSHKGIKVYLSMINGKIAYPIASEQSIILGVIACPEDVQHGYFIPIPTDNLLSTLSEVMVYNATKEIETSVLKSSANYYKSCIVLFDKNGYEAEALFNKQLSKLFMLCYTQEAYNDQRATQKLVDYKNEGFMWSNELWECLNDFENNRAKYPRFKDYLPVYVAKYQELLR